MPPLKLLLVTRTVVPSILQPVPPGNCSSQLHAGEVHVPIRVHNALQIMPSFGPAAPLLQFHIDVFLHQFKATGRSTFFRMIAAFSTSPEFVLPACVSALLRPVVSASSFVLHKL